MKSSRSIWRVINFIEHRYYRFKAKIYYRTFFRKIGCRSAIWTPINLSYPEFISIGNDVIIRAGARFEIIFNKDQHSFPSLEIGDNTIIEQYFHVACAGRIVIGKRVSITQRVGIFDIWHPYDNPDLAIADQPLRNACVNIGDDSFIGMGAVIQPGVCIGRHCIIGANSVVMRDLPDYSVAVGMPAKVIRQFNPLTKQWQKIE